MYQHGPGIVEYTRHQDIWLIPQESTAYWVHYDSIAIPSMFHLHAFRLAVKTTLRHAGPDVKKGVFDGKPSKRQKACAAAALNSDFYALIETLPAEELVVVKFDTDLLMTPVY